MKYISLVNKTLLSLLLTLTLSCITMAESLSVAQIVEQHVIPVMKEYHIPGIAVAVSDNGHNYFFNYGVASKDSNKPVTQQTLFQIGSLTKLYVATLASDLQATHKLTLTDSVSTFIPQLKSSEFDRISLLNLATHTSGLPLFLPRDIHNQTQLISYLKHWHPKYPIGSHRIYSNVGVGVLGLALGHDSMSKFEHLMKQQVFKPLDLQHTYFRIPSSQIKHFAQGYNQHGDAIITPRNLLLPGAYGLCSDSQDMLRFLNANMSELEMSPTLHKAILMTHFAYYDTQYLTQGLIWERYPFPLSFNTLMQGHQSELNARAEFVKHQLQMYTMMHYFDKTGTSPVNTFASYVAMVPDKHIAVVILANQFYPFNARPKLGYGIITALLKKS